MEIANDQQGPHSADSKAVALFVQELTTNTQQWVEYAHERAQAGDADEVANALVHINENMAELQRHNEVTITVISSLAEAVAELEEQRDEAIAEVTELRDELHDVRQELEWAETSAYDQFAYDMDSMVDVDEVHAEVEDDMDNSVELFVSELQRLGHPEEADALEREHRRRREAMESSDALFDQTRALVNKLKTEEWKRQSAERLAAHAEQGFVISDEDEDDGSESE